MIHELPLDAAYLHGAFSRELEPVLGIDLGDSVRISVPGFRWETARGVTFASTEVLDVHAVLRDDALEATEE